MLFTTLVACLPVLAAAVPSPIQHALTAPPAAEHDVIDLTKYTIGQILNYTLHHADDPDRHTPPLKKLAKAANFSGTIHYLAKEDISVTLFAPDDEALEHIGHGHGDHGHDHGDHGHGDHGHDHDGPGHHGPPGHGHDGPGRDGPPRGPPGHHDEYEAMSMMVDNHPLKALDSHFNGKRGDDDDDEKRHERIEKFRKLVGAILAYHVVPEKLYLKELQDRQTLPTALNQTSDTDVAFRIRVHPKLEILPPPPSYQVSLNFYARTRARAPTLLAKNGVIHFITAPLLPPLTPIDQLFLFPSAFSTLTSAIQQTELDHALAPYLHGHEDHGKTFLSTLEKDNEPNSVVLEILKELVEEAKAELVPSDKYEAFPFTIFAPTNGAFSKIPFKLRLFLFSPFGKPFLRGLLKFHVVPQYIFHTDYQLNASRPHSKGEEIVEWAAAKVLPEWLSNEHEEATSLAGLPHPHPPHPPHPPPRPTPPGQVNVTKYQLPTLLGHEKNQTLAVNVYTYRLAFGKGPAVRRIAVGNTEQDEKEYVNALISDGVAWGGAIHVVDRLIRPVFHHGDHGDHGHDHPHEHGRGPRGHENLGAYFEKLYKA